MKASEREGRKGEKDGNEERGCEGREKEGSEMEGREEGRAPYWHFFLSHFKPSQE